MEHTTSKPSLADTGEVPKSREALAEEIMQLDGWMGAVGVKRDLDIEDLPVGDMEFLRVVIGATGATRAIRHLQEGDKGAALLQTRRNIHPDYQLLACEAGIHAGHAEFYDILIDQVIEDAAHLRVTTARTRLYETAELAVRYGAPIETQNTLQALGKAIHA